MIPLTLANTANQTFNAVLNQAFFAITIKYVQGSMAITIDSAGTHLVSNLRMIPGVPLIPYTYLEHGNFILLTAGEDVADYTKFGISQILIYASPEELEEIRGSIIRS